MIIYRELHSPEEFEHLVDLQAHVWATTDRNSTPHNMLMAISHGGGVSIAAIDGDRYVGFNFAFIARRGDEYILWSHMTGVLADYQGQGIGKALKLTQRDWALAHGYQRINWTTDPLQRGNARFNLRLLGGMTNAYHANHYGPMNDSINAGMETDRFEITWPLNHPRVVQVAAGDVLQPVTSDDWPFLLEANAAGLPVETQPSGLDAAYYFIEIPRNIAAIKLSDINLAKRWQLAVRTTFTNCFRQGYYLVDFVDRDNRGWYVVARNFAAS